MTWFEPVEVARILVLYLYYKLELVKVTQVKVFTLKYWVTSCTKPVESGQTQT